MKEETTHRYQLGSQDYQRSFEEPLSFQTDCTMPCHHHYFCFIKPKGDGNLQSAGTDCARVGRYGIILIGMCYENIAND